MKGKVLIVLLLLLIPTVIAQTKPDIYITDVKIYPEEVYEGDQVRVEFDVGNYGSTAENISIALFVDNRTQVVDEIIIDKLDYNEKRTVSLYWIAKEGKHTLFLFADYEGRIDEENEDNNLVSVEINVQKPIYPPFPPPAENASWWGADWHYRVPVTISMIGQRENFTYSNKMVYCNINFTALMDKISYEQAGSFAKRTFNPSSVRVIEYKLQENKWVPVRSVGREIIFSNDYDAIENANVTVIWVMEDEISPHERRYYYIYWDTVENGYKRGEFAKIYSGIKNAEFEDIHSTQWKNVTDGPVKWQLGYVEDPVEHDHCYKIYAKGLYGKGYLWAPSYVKVFQNIKVPDDGKTYYILHAKVFVTTDLEGAEWNILIDGQSVYSGVSTGGWIEITKNITSYLKNRNYVTISFKMEVTQTLVSAEQHEITAYIDSFWIETPDIAVDLFSNETHGWWGVVKGVETSYIAGVEGKDKIEKIEVNTVASPKEVIAKLYSPQAEVVKSSMPFPDPSFEREDYIYLFYSDELTCSAELQSVVRHTGEKAVELRLSNYVGKWEFEKEQVKINDMAGFRQNITYGIPLAELPELYFWYNIEKYAEASYLNFTLLTKGVKPKFHTIHLSDLISDGKWHKYSLPADVLQKWRISGGQAIAIEIRLVANAEGAENIVYIDDLGYSFMPANATDRTKWYLEDFYQFTSGNNIGNWRLDIIMADGSDYRIEKSLILKVDAAANLEVYNINSPSQVKEGDIAKFKVHITNHGPKEVNETTPINVSLIVYQEGGETFKMVKSVAGLKVNEKKEIEFEWQASYGLDNAGGVWKVIAKVNEKGRIPEWEMKDNWYATTIKVEPMPDLKIDMEDVVFEPSHPSENETVNISIIVHNIGFANATAKVKIYEKLKDGGKYLLITNKSIQIFVERKSWEKISWKWKEKEGIYSIKVEVSCEEERNTKNNVVIKDIRVGGGDDFTPPVIEGIRIAPKIQALGKYINFSATIYDENTTIDKAKVVIYNDSKETEYCMIRIGDTDVYYVNLTFNEIGYYYFAIRAWDTASDGWQNMAESEKIPFRIVYEGIETNAPIIKAVTIEPPSARQVLNGVINISAYIDDESGIAKAMLIVERNGEINEYEMKKGANNIYYYSKAYDKVGEYSYYIKAVDASANANYNTSPTYTFEVPEDYDLDDIPDKIEIEIGADPTNASQTINVSVGNQIGYLIWIEEKNNYIYWDRDANKTRDVILMDVDGDGKMEYLFDVNGNGKPDYYYDEQDKIVNQYETKEEKKLETVWILPPLLLFIIVCVAFLVVIKKK